MVCPWNSPGQNTGVGCHSLLQGIFPTQGLNPDPQHCRQTPTQVPSEQPGKPHPATLGAFLKMSKFCLKRPGELLATELICPLFLREESCRGWENLEYSRHSISTSEREGRRKEVGWGGGENFGFRIYLIWGWVKALHEQIFLQITPWLPSSPPSILCSYVPFHWSQLCYLFKSTSLPQPWPSWSPLPCSIHLPQNLISHPI